MERVVGIPRLPARARDGHKGTFGTVCVVGGCCRGSRRYVGAAALAALGALRAGCGLCRVMAPEPVIGHVLGVVSSATGVSLAVGADGSISGRHAAAQVLAAAEHGETLVVGPGLGDGPGVDAVVRSVWRSVRGPLVLDADGLNALCRQRRIGQAGGPVVVTPHPGEARRLMVAVGVEGGLEGETARERAAGALARRLGCIVVLKGHRTVVSDGVRMSINTSGGPWLGTGGTGDVLAGLIGGLLAQHAGRIDVLTLVRAAVLAHGRAGDRWKRTHRATGGMLAAELSALVPAEVQRLRRPG